MSQRMFSLGQMRILHTSDWHLGRKFGDHSLLDDQIEFLDWLVEVVAQRSVDLVAIAGDIYDRTAPSSDVVGLFSDFLRRLLAMNVKVVAIAGNHDNAMRFDSFDGMTEPSGALLRGGFRCSSDVLLWKFDDVDLAILAVPFLDPRLAPESTGTRLTHEDVLAAALTSGRQKIPEGARSLVLSHSFVQGGKISDSERELSVGTAGMVSSEIFEGFDYVALGHLHRPQTVGEGVCYSGSPLAYSFSETSKKSVSLVELDPNGLVGVEQIEVEVGQGVQSLIGEIEELCDGPTSDLWTRVELTDSRAVLDAKRRLKPRFPRIVEVARSIDRPDDTETRLTVSEIRSMQPDSLATDFWLDVTGHGASPLQNEAMKSALSDSEAP